MAFRYVVAETEMPSLAANKIQGYSNRLCEILWSDDAATEAFKKAIQAVDAALAGGSLTRDTVKTQSFSDAVKVALDAVKVALDAVQAQPGADAHLGLDTNATITPAAGAGRGGA